jgi:hypothetical protein
VAVAAVAGNGRALNTPPLSTTVVVEAAFAIVNAALPLEPACEASPPYVAVTWYVPALLGAVEEGPKLVVPVPTYENVKSASDVSFNPPAPTANTEVAGNADTLYVPPASTTVVVEAALAIENGTALLMLLL